MPRARVAAPPSGLRLKARPGGATSPGVRFSVPELPEVETIVREIAPRLEGCRITHVQLRKTDGRKFVYRDVRRLGTIWLLDEKGWIAYTGRIGPEPLEETFTPFVFADRLKGTRTAVKKAIMDQRRLAGVGNIYANEALFDARLDPSKQTHKLSLEEFSRLHAAIVDVLQRALASSGTTLRDYRTGTGERGRFQFELRVYGRGGEQCVRCGRKLTMTHKIDLRQTTFCRRCQR